MYEGANVINHFIFSNLFSKKNHKDFADFLRFKNGAIIKKGQHYY
jgi:hypothetical protein